MSVDGKQIRDASIAPAKADLTQVWAFTAAPSYNADPSGANDLVRKSYADSLATGLDFKNSCKLATDAALPANTPSGSGVGKIITADAVGILTVDGIATVLNDRLLIKDEGSGQHNGIYDVTTEGTAGVAFVLTRATDADQDAEVTPGMYAYIEQGTVNGETAWVCNNTGTITVDTTALTFSQFSGAGQVVAGAGLTKSANTLNVGAGNGITVNADDVEVDYALNASFNNIQSDAGTAADGTANTALRGDAQMLAATGTPVAIGTANAQGSSTDLARADHVHDAPAMATADKEQTPSATTIDEDTTGLTISATPALDSHVEVMVNGIQYELGDGAKTGDCFFSADGGTTPKSIAAIASGDTLYWMQSVAGFNLATTDRLDFNYLSF